MTFIITFFVCAYLVHPDTHLGTVHAVALICSLLLACNLCRWFCSTSPCFNSISSSFPSLSLSYGFTSHQHESPSDGLRVTVICCCCRNDHIIEAKYCGRLALNWIPYPIFFSLLCSTWSFRSASVRISEILISWTCAEKLYWIECSKAARPLSIGCWYVLKAA